MKTAGPAARLTLRPDRERIRADGKDLSFVTVAVVDKSGLLVPRSKNAIRFGIEGPGDCSHGQRRPDQFRVIPGAGAQGLQRPGVGDCARPGRPGGNHKADR